MVLSDIFTVPLLISIFITFLLVGVAVYYLLNKLKEQDRKIYSMVDLVTTMANEMNLMKRNLVSYQGGGINNIVPFSQEQDVEKSNKYLGNSDLIEVSDDDEDDDTDVEDNVDDISVESGSEEEDNDDDDENSDNESESDSDSDSDDDCENEVINLDSDNIISSGEVKHININYGLMTIDEDELEEINDSTENSSNNEESNDDENELEELEEVSLSASNNDDDDDNESLDLNDIVSSHLDESINNTDEKEELKLEEEIKIVNNDLNLLKTININLDEASDSKNDTIEYKKMPLNKLKSVVLEKGLALDSSKMKKQELLKLLGAE